MHSRSDQLHILLRQAFAYFIRDSPDIAAQVQSLGDSDPKVKAKAEQIAEEGQQAQPVDLDPALEWPQWPLFLWMRCFHIWQWIIWVVAFGDTPTFAVEVQLHVRQLGYFWDLELDLGCVDGRIQRCQRVLQATALRLGHS